MSSKNLKVALVGNPNSGKTTLFNILTGSNAHVGNWPGVTVEKKSGIYKKTGAEIIDLPGIYSLSPYSPEELISRNYILQENPDCIINIVDATNIERNLYLTTQLLETDIPVVVALNMADLVKKNGDKIDAAALECSFGVPFVEISALKNTGIDELMQAADKIVNKKHTPFSVLSISEHQGIFQKAKEFYDNKSVNHSIFRCVKALESDEQEKKDNPEIYSQVQELIKSCEIDFEGVIADLRYRYITEKIKGHIKKNNCQKNFITKSDRIDRVLTHKYFGIPLFLLIMFTVFHITFSANFLFLGQALKDVEVLFLIGEDGLNSPGVILQELVVGGWDAFAGLIESVLATSPPWVSGIIVNGLLGGVGAVLSFMPQIMVLFLFLSILEASGYMARVAFIMDRAFRKFGLSGKAFMPLLMCFGCAVPGIMATRTLESEKERRLSIMLAPFFSCGAKLPIWIAVIGVLFGSNEFAVYGIYLLGIAVAILAAFILKRTALKGETPPFIMELPAYHAPKFTNLMRQLWDKLKHYIIRAATIIAASSIVIWVLANFNAEGMVPYVMVEVDGELVAVADISQSMLGHLGKALQPLFLPLGFASGSEGWTFIVASLTGLVAKEEVPATLTILSGSIGLNLFSLLSGPAAFAFMAFNLLVVPCMAAVAAARGELNNGKHFWTAIGFWMLTAYVVSAAVYWLGRFIFAPFANMLLGSGLSISPASLLTILIIMAFIAAVILLVVLIRLPFNIKNNKTCIK